MPINITLQQNSLLVLGIILGGFISLLVWLIFLQMKINQFSRLNKIFFRGEKIKNLEEVLLNQAETLKILDKDIQELYSISNKINTLATNGLYKFSTVRFNPFKETGGNQSFSIALLNGKNNGLTITALHSREGTRVYAKSLLNGESENFPLTEEERNAIKLAINPQKKFPGKEKL